jgi:hypothetical protein
MAIVIFPANIKLAYASTKSQSWNVTVKTHGSGSVRTQTNQLYPAWSIKTKANYLTDAEARSLQGFIAKTKGGTEPFFWLDPEDHQEIGTPLPMITAGLYQLVMTQGDYREPVDYADNITVYVDGVEQKKSDYSLTTSGGIKFTKAPESTAKVTADYRYYFHMYIPAGKISINHEFDDFNRTDSFTMQVWRPGTK